MGTIRVYGEVQSYANVRFTGAQAIMNSANENALVHASPLEGLQGVIPIFSQASSEHCVLDHLVLIAGFAGEWSNDVDSGLPSRKEVVDELSIFITPEFFVNGEPVQVSST